MQWSRMYQVRKRKKFVYNFSLGRLRGRENLEDLDLYGNIVLMAGGLL